MMGINNIGILKQAIYYANKGMAVFPLHTPIDGKCSCGKVNCKSPGKHPRTSDGSKSATKDREQITEWWTKWPEANIGIATGAISGIVVIDVDCDHKTGKFGEESLKAWESKNSQLPNTWTSLTGGGGMHYIFSSQNADLRNRAGILDNVDIRANGGYIVAPPSLHISGIRYIWKDNMGPEEMLLAPLPREWRDLIKKRLYDKKTLAIPDIIPKGKRNDTLFHIACFLQKKGLLEHEILAAIIEENETRCSPPLGELEINMICQSAARYKQTNETNKLETSLVKPGDFSDAGNAEVFSRIYKDKLIYVEALGWLYWNGKKWERNNYCAIYKAHELSSTMLREAESNYQKAKKDALFSKELADVNDEKALRSLKEANTYLKHVGITRSNSHLDKMTELSKPYLLISLDKLDSNPYDLNTTCGTINLKIGNIRKHDPKDYISKIANGISNNKNKDIWNAFITIITCGDEKLANFLQMIAGMASIGAVYHEGIIIAYGEGHNGKSTFFNSIVQVLGDYAGSISVNALTTQQTNKGAALATLRGRRLILTGELEENQRLSVSMLKMIASTDRIVAEEKYRQPEEFTPSHSIILFTNHLPKIRSTDNGTWRRLTVIPFNAVIPKDDAIQKYSDVLVDSAGEAIMSWIIEGAVKFCKNKFKLDIPEPVLKATEEYRKNENCIVGFIESCCKKGDRVGGRELYNAYKAWSQSREDYAIRENEFVNELVKLGYIRSTSNGRRYRKDLSLIPK